MQEPTVSWRQCQWLTNNNNNIPLLYSPQYIDTTMCLSALQIYCSQIDISPCAIFCKCYVYFCVNAPKYSILLSIIIFMVYEQDILYFEDIKWMITLLFLFYLGRKHEEKTFDMRSRHFQNRTDMLHWLWEQVLWIRRRKFSHPWDHDSGRYNFFFFFDFRRGAILS